MTADSLGPQKPPRARRVMIVDDHDAVRDIICMFLNDSGYDAVACGSGVEALARLDATQPDLILMDLRMPEVDGYETTRRIRQQARWDSVPIVAYSCEVDSDSEPVLKALGFNGWLAKPSPLEQIEAVIAHFVNRKRRH